MQILYNIASKWKIFAFLMIFILMGLLRVAAERFGEANSGCIIQKNRIKVMIFDRNKHNNLFIKQIMFNFEHHKK